MKERQQHITIQIADQPQIDLDIRPEAEELVRKTERSVNKVWRRWCADFKHKSPGEVLAMVTYQYAKLYYELVDRIDRDEKMLSDFDAELSRLLLDVK